jgi:hypothetical protein
VPVVDPVGPLVAASTGVVAGAGIPVLDAVPDVPPSPGVIDAPTVVAEPPALATDPRTAVAGTQAVVADAPAVMARSADVVANAGAGAVAPIAGNIRVVPAATTANASASSIDPAVDPRNQPLESLGPPPAPNLDPRPFAEAHWQGLEAIPKTPTVAKMLKVPPNVDGVILDDVTLPADLQGFKAGDVVTAVDGVPTPDLVSFIRATDRIRDAKRVTVDFVRRGMARQMDITALFDRLGTANGETPPMIPPGAQRPHIYMGPCVNCHRIGTTGNLAVDQGDNPKNKPGPVKADGPVPHRDRGPCATCHPIIP